MEYKAYTAFIGLTRNHSKVFQVVALDEKKKKNSVNTSYAIYTANTRPAHTQLKLFFDERIVGNSSKHRIMDLSLVIKYPKRMKMYEYRIVKIFESTRYKVIHSLDKYPDDYPFRFIGKDRADRVISYHRYICAGNWWFDYKFIDYLDDYEAPRRLRIWFRRREAYEDSR